MKLTSITARSTCSGRSPRERYRAFRPSRTTTRGSLRSDQSRRPRPTSSAYTRAAPRLRRQSVNPPVEAPMSRARRPETATPRRASAPSSLTPPRPTNGWSGARTSIAASGDRSVPGFCPALPSTRTTPARTRACARSRLLARPRSTSSRSRRSFGRLAVPAPACPSARSSPGFSRRGRLNSRGRR